MEGSVASASSEPLIETLISRGWCFGDLEPVKALIVIQSALLDEGFTVDVIESELANMDLRAVGGKSLPDNVAIRKLSHIQGPKVLQISSVRDVSRSTVAEESGSSNSWRLLRLGLTDGHTEIIAVEYSHIPSIPDHVVPGTKVRLENKALVHNGIVCLNSKVVTVLGGVVQTLYEEWQMNKKYSGFSRSLMKPSGDNEASGPPPFQKLQIEEPAHQFAHQGRFPYHSELNTSKAGPTNVKTNQKSEIRQVERGQNLDPKLDTRSAGPKNAKTYQKPEIMQVERKQNLDLKLDDLHNDIKRTQIERTEEIPSSSETRAKEVPEFVPVQNQAASQKLLQKMSHSNRDGRHVKGQRHRGKGKQEDLAVYTLHEWKESRAMAKPLMTRADEHGDGSCDEELARQLQNQFDLKNFNEVPHETEAERLRRSIFNFERHDNHFDETGYRGRTRRGWGRGSRKGRFS